MALEKQLVAQRLGQQIARYRAKLGLTQEEAAAKVGVTHRAYQRWESGEAMPYPRNVERVADAFGVGVDDLLGEAAQAPIDLGQAALLGRMEEVLIEILDRLDLLEAELAATLIAQLDETETPPDEEDVGEATG